MEDAAPRLIMSPNGALRDLVLQASLKMSAPAGRVCKESEATDADLEMQRGACVQVHSPCTESVYVPSSKCLSVLWMMAIEASSCASQPASRSVVDRVHRAAI